MKTRKFDIENYDVSKMAKELLKEKHELDVFAYGGVILNNVKVAVSYGAKFEKMEGLATQAEKLKVFDKDAQAIILERLKADYETKKQRTIEAYKKQKDIAEKVLFDDKDYIELCEVLKNNYVCQASTMLGDLIEAKTKGKSVKAMKYNARLLQYNDISCD